MQPSGTGGQVLARRTHKKSKTGCKTCRVRKVKCDERRPLCRNCERHFIGLVSCDFDNQSARLQLNIPRPNEHPGRESEPLHLPMTVSAGRIDPFEARPQSDTSAAIIDSLMAHYLSNLAYRSFPFYASKLLLEAWWPFVRGDTVLFHVIMLLSSIDKDRTESQAMSEDASRLLDQSLAFLRRRLEDTIASIADSTVAAISLLAAMEHERGNARALQAHLVGLRRMVELRGGLLTIREGNPIVGNTLFWCVLVSINEYSILPPLFLDNRDTTDTLQSMEHTTLLTHDGGEANLLSFGVDVQTAYILHEVQRLSRLHTSTLTYSTASEAMEVLTELCIMIQRLLLPNNLSSNDTAISALSRSCRLAGCLHVFTPIAGYFPSPTLMLHSLVRDIKTSLARLIGDVGTKSHLLLWLLAVAGVTAHSMPERAWFVGHLVVLVSDLRLQTWEDFRSYLVDLAFHDNFCDISFHALWEEVRRKQEILNLQH